MSILLLKFDLILEIINYGLFDEEHFSSFFQYLAWKPGSQWVCIMTLLLFMSFKFIHSLIQQIGILCVNTMLFAGDTKLLDRPHYYFFQDLNSLH